MSGKPTLEITIKIQFFPCDSGAQYQVGGECYTCINGGTLISGKFGPLRDFMPTQDVKAIPTNNIDVCLKGTRQYIFFCDVNEGLRAFNAILRRATRGDQ